MKCAFELKSLGERTALNHNAIQTNKENRITQKHELHCRIEFVTGFPNSLHSLTLTSASPGIIETQIDLAPNIHHLVVTYTSCSTRITARVRIPEPSVTSLHLSAQQSSLSAESITLSGLACFRLTGISFPIQPCIVAASTCSRQKVCTQIKTVSMCLTRPSPRRLPIAKPAVGTSNYHPQSRRMLCRPSICDVALTNPQHSASLELSALTACPCSTCCHPA